MPQHTVVSFLLRVDFVCWGTKLTFFQGIPDSAHWRKPVGVRPEGRSEVLLPWTLLKRKEKNKMSEVKNWLNKANTAASLAANPILPAQQRKEALASLCWGCKDPELASWINDGLINPDQFAYPILFKVCLLSMADGMANENLPKLERQMYLQAYQKLMGYNGFETEKRSSINETC